MWLWNKWKKRQARIKEIQALLREAELLAMEGRVHNSQANSHQVKAIRMRRFGESPQKILKEVNKAAELRQQERHCWDQWKQKRDRAVALQNGETV